MLLSSWWHIPQDKFQCTRCSICLFFHIFLLFISISSPKWVFVCTIEVPNQKPSWNSLNSCLSTLGITEYLESLEHGKQIQLKFKVFLSQWNFEESSAVGHVEIFQGEDKLLYLAPPIIKEVHHLVGLFAFWRQPIPHTGVLLQPIY